MTIDDLSNLIHGKMKEIQEFVEGDDIKDIIGTEAVNHFKGSFDNEGFTDEKLEKWEDVERRDPDSDWYGHSGQTGKFSQARTTAKILSGETGELKDGIYYIHIPNGVKITSPTPYGRVQQYGLLAKIYGKKSFQMKPRPYIGKSVLMMRNINDKIKRELIKRLKQ